MPLAHMVGQPAHRQHVRRAVKRQPVVGVEPFLGQHFGGHRLQPGVDRSKGMNLECVARGGADLAGTHGLSAHGFMIPKSG